MTTQIDELPPEEWFATATDLLKALAVESRLRILWALLHGEHSVNELANHVGASPSAVSQHLRQLRRLGLVTTRRQGNFIFYSCDHVHVRALVTEALSHAQHVVGDEGLGAWGPDRQGERMSGRGHGEAHGSEGHSHHASHSDEHHDAHEHRRRRGPVGFVIGLVGGHSHDHAESLDDSLMASRAGMRALTISLAGLLVTAVLQLIVFSISDSVGLLADTIHNFADAFTAVPIGAVLLIARRPATRRYTYGFGRSEDLAGLAVLLVIAASAVIAGWEAVSRLVHPQQVSNLGWVAATGMIGFIGNEVAARYRISVGQRIGSAALVADGHHARTDGFTSLAVVAGAIGVALGWRLADPIVGMAITVTILGVLRGAARDIYRRLMDAVDPALVGQVESEAAGVDGVRRVDDVRVRWVGHELRAELNLTVDGNLRVSQAHDIAEHVRHRLLHHVHRLGDATIHTDPAIAGHDPHGLTAHHYDR